MPAIPSEEALRDEIYRLRVRILDLHTKAWKYRVENDLISMQGMHRIIRACQKRIEDCQWGIEYVQVDKGDTGS